MTAFEAPRAGGVAAAADLLVEPFEPATGHIPLPSGAGLGIDVDEDAVRTLSETFQAS